MAFSLYLTHKAVYHLVRQNLGGLVLHAALPALAIYMGAALAVGTLLYLAVERPGIRLRERYIKMARSGERRAIS